MDDSTDRHLMNADVVESTGDSPFGGSGPTEIFSRHRRGQHDAIEIRPYDFRRPERISKDQMRALQTLHDAFARNFGASLSGFLRTIIEVNVDQAEQMTYSEFLGSLANPTCFSLIAGEPLEGQFCLEISPLIIYPIIDRLMGGNTRDLFVPQRPMTMIEMRLVRRILERGMDALVEAWGSIGQFDFQLGEMESNPQLVQIVPPNEVVVVIGFEVRMGERTGTMKLCLPYNVIEPVIENLSTQNWFVTGRRDEKAARRKVIEQGLSEAPLELEVVLAETSITFDELQSLRVGDLITTTKPSKEPVVVSVGGSPKFDGTFGSFRGNRAVRIGNRQGQRPSGVDSDGMTSMSTAPSQGAEKQTETPPDGFLDATG
jgi:flagellar motor switch protein FliM